MVQDCMKPRYCAFPCLPVLFFSCTVENTMNHPSHAHIVQKEGRSCHSANEQPSMKHPNKETYSRVNEWVSESIFYSI